MSNVPEAELDAYLELVPWKMVEGAKTAPRLWLFSLSTCGFCRKAMTWLSQQGYAFGYAHLDELDPGLKQRIKDAYLQGTGRALSYPTLIRDGLEPLVGFISSTWQDAFGV